MTELHKLHVSCVLWVLHVGLLAFRQVNKWWWWWWYDDDDDDVACRRVGAEESDDDDDAASSDADWWPGGPHTATAQSQEAGQTSSTTDHGTRCTAGHHVTWWQRWRWRAAQSTVETSLWSLHECQPATLTDGQLHVLRTDWSGVSIQRNARNVRNVTELT